MFLKADIFVENALLPKWYVFFTGTLIGCILWSVQQKRIIKIDALVITVTLFIGYVCVRTYCSEPHNIRALSPFFFLLIFIFFKSTCPDDLRHIDKIIVTVCVLQSLYGIMQFAGICYISSSFNLLGSFDTPGGYAACLCAGYPLCFAFLGKRNILGLFSMTIIAAGIIISESRSGIIAIAIVSAIFFYNRHNLFFQKKKLGIAIIVGAFLLLFASLFVLKKNSALGRMLIWKVSVSMVADAPIFGIGPNGFSSNYMEYQADYLETHISSPYKSLADNVAHPFNEYLLLVIEYGIVGFVLLGLISVVVFIHVNNRNLLYLLPLLSIGIFACFSYPLRYPYVIALIGYCLSRFEISSRFKSNTYDLPANLALRIAAGIMIVAGFIYLARDVKFEYDWGKTIEGTRRGKPDAAISYEKLYTQWNGNPLFLYNYGAYLHNIEQYVTSSDILNKCEKYLNNYDVQMILADNHLKLTNWTKAEYHYKKALKMIPGRFLPLGHLLDIYIQTGRSIEAKHTAINICLKTIKVQSPIINSIQSKAKIYLQEQHQNQIFYTQ